MTPAELRSLRLALGMTREAFASALDPARPPNPRTIGRWEDAREDGKPWPQRIPQWAEARARALERTLYRRR